MVYEVRIEAPYYTNTFPIELDNREREVIERLMRYSKQSSEENGTPLTITIEQWYIVN